jgi:hypothetical protein
LTEVQELQSIFFEPAEKPFTAHLDHHGEQARKDGGFNPSSPTFKLHVDIIG